ncbi:S-methyl-5-thioribose-1-phosphate isomerase [Pleurotus ostreatus]|uniref:Methylthioribose-1-phosphate isomerase n=1 Tax=Pleurotus ostreatus TaxID=5322 RepID=A0A8H7DU97_PLEOS|nr:S-methyl-5-thioribose-1-phosphate isomerase [Pleurotus ostreatus]KAF7428238.1 S-methyl-5-thioribose-1-phosphate isomerase [Pleurotus ostreatus]
MSQSPFTLQSFKYSDDRLEILNQLLLPHTIEYVEINSVEEAHDAIKSMKIRGAPAIASLAALYIALYLKRSLNTAPAPKFLASTESLAADITPILDYLYTARPTAVNLGAAMRRLHQALAASVAAAEDVQSATRRLIKEAEDVSNEDVGRNKEMARLGGEWLIEQVKQRGGGGKELNVLTVCNTGSLATSGYGTALGLITYLHETGHLDKAYYTQTAPYHQGSRLTALELQTLQIPSVMICDTMSSISAVGADRVAKNGDTANKIGTYNAAVLAARHNIPFIVVAPVSTVDLDVPDGSRIPIEHRPPVEACIIRGALYPGTEDDKAQAVVMFTPKGLTGIYNPSFDVTPAELITAIVTEKGVAVKKEGEQQFDLSGIV